MKNVSPKVGAATAAAAAVTIIVWGVEASTGIDIPSLVEGAATTLGVFVFGWLVPDAARGKHAAPEE